MVINYVAVTDNPDVFRFSRSRPEYGLEVVGIDDFDRIEVGDATRLVVDFDLLDPEKVGIFKRHAGAARAAARLVLIDRGAHSQYVQARSLDATEIAPRPLTEGVLAHLRTSRPARRVADMGSSQRPPSVPGAERMSIQAAADLLVSLFASRSGPMAIDLERVATIGNQVIAAVAAVGLDRWLTSVRAHHTGTFQHSLLVTGVAAGLGRYLGLSQADLRLLTATALLHDIGKARIPVELLNKPGRLTEAEFAVMKQHVTIGRDILAGVPAVSPIMLDGVHHHHEYLDGSGYPDGLAGTAICDNTRLLTIADIFSALIEKRAYKKPRSDAEAVTMLGDLAQGGKIDKVLVASLARLITAQSVSR
jgi:putative nucleotidyltransferase with HDIG domain